MESVAEERAAIEASSQKGPEIADKSRDSQTASECVLALC